MPAGPSIASSLPPAGAAATSCVERGKLGVAFEQVGPARERALRVACCRARRRKRFRQSVDDQLEEGSGRSDVAELDQAESRRRMSAARPGSTRSRVVLETSTWPPCANVQIRAA